LNYATARVRASICEAAMADYETWGIKWQGPTVSWHYSGPEQFRGDIQRAMNRWDGLIDIDFTHAGSSASADTAMWFEGMDGPYGILGEAGGPAYSTDGANFYFSGDSSVRFDAHESWYWADWAGGMVLASGVTFYELALHEIGHALGMGHSTNFDTIMYPNIGGSATDITYWDEVGIHSLYAPEGGSNSAPVMTVDDIWTGAGNWTQLSTIASILDPDGDNTSLYELWNGAGETSTWWADGHFVDASNGYQTWDLNSIWFKGHDWAGDQNLWVRAFDGKDWGEWDQFTIHTSGSNQAPVVTINDHYLETGQWTQVSNVASIWDADGDYVVRYELWNSAGESTAWWADGRYVDASNGYQTDNLHGLWFKGQDWVGSQNLWIRAFDGKDWGEWDQFTITTHSGNQAPVVAVEDQWVANGQWTKLTDVASIWDPNGDYVEEYELWNGSGASTTWWADGHYVDASGGYRTSDLDSISFKGQDWAGQQNIWIRGRDGSDWGQWDQITIHTNDL
jgi:hypothetical protein